MVSTRMNLIQYKTKQQKKKNKFPGIYIEIV